MAWDLGRSSYHGPGAIDHVFDDIGPQAVRATVLHPDGRLTTVQAQLWVDTDRRSGCAALGLLGPGETGRLPWLVLLGLPWLGRLLLKGRGLQKNS